MIEFEYVDFDENFIISKLENRFHEHLYRHANINWNDLKQKLHHKPISLYCIWRMEVTGGEPDVIEFDSVSKKYLFVDCAKESPKMRRNFCYDREALDARKKFKPLHCAVDKAGLMGTELMTVEQYYKLQKIEQVDTKTSSWLHTPPEIRKLGGALFGVNRYNSVFIYPNSADAYFSDRGFRTAYYI
jgi:hypothetical protein